MYGLYRTSRESLEVENYRWVSAFKHWPSRVACRLLVRSTSMYTSQMMVEWEPQADGLVAISRAHLIVLTSTKIRYG